MASFNVQTTQHYLGLVTSAAHWAQLTEVSSARITQIMNHRFKFPKVGVANSTLQSSSLNLYMYGGGGSTVTLDLFITSNGSLLPNQTSSMTSIGRVTVTVPDSVSLVPINIPQGGLATIWSQSGDWYIVVNWVSGVQPDIYTPAVPVYIARIIGEYSQGIVNTNVGGTWRKGPMWVNVSGTWKQGITWTNVGGTWKQGI